MVRDKSTPFVSNVLRFYEKEDLMATNLTNLNIEKDMEQVTSYIRSIIIQFCNKEQVWLDSKKCNDVLVKAIMLRRINRLSNFRNRLLRERFKNTCGKVETHFLQIQNLRSEIGHFKKTIDLYLEFQSLDFDIDLITLEEFYLKKSYDSDVKKHDPHSLQLDRLSFELKERKSTLSNLQELEDRKSLLLSDINGKEQRLLQVKPKITALKLNAKPLLEILGLKSIDSAFEQKKKLEYLPKELELVKLSAGVFNEIFNEKLDISCEGDEEKAIRFTAECVTSENENLLQQPVKNLSDEEMDFEKEDEFYEDVPSKKFRRSRKSLNEGKELNGNVEKSSLVFEKLKQKRDNLLSTHPILLSIVVPIELPNESVVNLRLSFIYLNQLKCIGLKCKFIDAKFSNWPLFDTDYFLDDLFDGDFGNFCPNPIGEALLNSLCMNISNYASLTGKPYKFVQKLCGLIVVENKELQNSKNRYAKLNIEVDKEKTFTTDGQELSCLHSFELFVNVLQRIKCRVLFRFVLSENLKEIEKLNSFQFLPLNLKQQIPSKIISQLSSFASLNVEEFLSHDGLSAIQKSLLSILNNNGCLMNVGFKYKAVITRGKFELHSLIYLPASYPRNGPVYLLVIQSVEHKKSIEFASGILELEQFINTISEKIWHQCTESSDQNNSDLLHFQIALLCSRLDVVLELTAQKVAEYTQLEQEFPLEHNFATSRNCGQRFPFFFNNTTNSFCFE